MEGEIEIVHTPGKMRGNKGTSLETDETVKKKPGRPKTAAKPKNPSAIQVVRTFMQQQADVNKAILEQLAVLRDKCVSVPSGSNSGESNDGGPTGGSGNDKDKRVHDINPDLESEESEVDSEIEARIQSDVHDAQALLQPKFTKNSGRQLNVKKIEQKVNVNRPFAYLDREKQRDLTRQNIHPEELDILNHIEGLVGMASAIVDNNQVKGILAHIHQVVIDSQVHKWPRVRRWSNQVIFRVATGTWDWDSVSQIAQEHNSQYVIQYPAGNKDPIYPCYAYNKGECRYDSDHFSSGSVLSHICAFCFSLDGSKDVHISRSCERRRSSSNYFRAREENRDGNDKKGKEVRREYLQYGVRCLLR